MAKKKVHYDRLPSILESYAISRDLDYQRYSSYHMRLMDGGFTVLDVWTSARYYILTTDYLEMVGPGHRERGGEKGTVKVNPDKLFPWLDQLFFPEETDTISSM